VSHQLIGADELLERLHAEHGGPPGGCAPLGTDLRLRMRRVLADAFRPLVQRGSEGPWARGRCVGLYGVDLIFEEAGPQDGAQPVLLEVNYSPDLAAISRFRPSFVDEVFEQLFLRGEGMGEGACEGEERGGEPTAVTARPWERIEI
jgi:hypothetical protein